MIMRARDLWVGTRTTHTGNPHFGRWRTDDDRTDVARRNVTAPPATTFVARVILVGIALVMAVTLILAAPPKVTIPIAVVLALGFTASVALSEKTSKTRAHTT